MPMNTDSRYGRGDIRFTMNISWFETEILWECGSLSERDNNDEDNMEEFFAMIEAEIGDYLDTQTMRYCSGDTVAIGDCHIWDYLSSIASVMEEIDRFYIPDNDDYHKN